VWGCTVQGLLSCAVAMSGYRRQAFDAPPARRAPLILALCSTEHNGSAALLAERRGLLLRWYIRFGGLVVVHED